MGEIKCRFYNNGKYIETYVNNGDGTDVILNVYKIIRKHLCKIDERDGYNFKLFYCINVKDGTEEWFKEIYYKPYVREIIFADEYTINEFGILCKPE